MEKITKKISQQKGRHNAWLEKANLLTESLPFIQFYNKAIIVIKYGGSAMGNEALSKSFANDVVFLKQSGMYPVIVHGGGPQIANMLERLGIKTKFSNGLRVTDEKTVKVVEMVLAGKINKKIVSDIHKAGGKAVGISGKDGNLLVAKKAKSHKQTDSAIEKIVDLGYVGTPSKVNVRVINTLIQGGFIPVIAPIATSKEGKTYNVNADTAAGHIAQSLGAKRLLLLTDVSGVKNEKGEHLNELTTKQAEQLIKNNVVKGGMVPKLQTAIEAKKHHVDGVGIVDGRKKHVVLLELLTELGAGTLMK